MRLSDITPQVTVYESLRQVNGRWARVNTDTDTVVEFYHGTHATLLEGGNVFKDKASGEALTQRINQADVEPTIRFLEKITGVPHLEHALGTTGKTPTSGDLDIGVPADVSKQELVAKLSQWCSQHGENAQEFIKKSGISVHFKTPIGGSPERGYVQTDFMFVPNLDFAKFAMAADPQSKYRGAHKQILLSSIAKVKGLTWNPTTGLSSRETKKLVDNGDNPDHVAEVLFGPGFDRSSLTSVEAVLRALENNPQREELLADARETLGREGIEI
jgi:hypothetical protein